LAGAGFGAAGFATGDILAPALGDVGWADFAGGAVFRTAAFVVAGFAAAFATARRGGAAWREALAPRPFTAVPADTFMLDTS
jgi:hypothetical protein